MKLEERKEGKVDGGKGGGGRSRYCRRCSWTGKIQVSIAFTFNVNGFFTLGIL